MGGERKNMWPFKRPVKEPQAPARTPKTFPGLVRRTEVVKFSRSLIGIKEIPDGSNSGPAVHEIQTSTSAFGAPWCVSTVQFEDEKTIGSIYANRTANAYYYASFAEQAGHVVKTPVAGCAVIYHIGQGHAGRVVLVHPDGTFDAVEGNEGNAVKLVTRDPKVIQCTFVLRPEYR